jgi:hypothetical protein
MRSVQPLLTIAGFLCLLATLLLASPGVRVVHAAEDGAAGVAALPAGPTCDANATAEESAALQTFLAQLRRERLHTAAVEGRTVSLNNRGYAYGRPPGIDIGRIEREARTQRR